MSPLAITIIVAMLIAAGVFLMFTIINNISVCPPSEVLIFSGRSRRLVDGRTVGYRIIRGGRAMRIPLIETKDRMQLTNMAIELQVTNAFSRGGIPLKVHAVANVKLPSEESLLHNAIERFLGTPREGIMRVAKDTLEGNLRGVIAELTPEEINQQKMIFQQKLIEEADKDLHRLGLLLDNLQIQNISDDVSYLSSVGRVRSARIKKEARIAELKAWTSAAVQKAHNQMNAELSKIETDAQIAQKENQRRIVEAQTKREAVIAEVRGQVQAQLAEARAQLKAWEAKAEQVRRKLEADVIASARAAKEKAENEAKANAASVAAEGRAAAAALVSLSQAYQSGGRNARDYLLLQKLLPVFEELTGTMKAVRVDKLTLLGGSGPNSSFASQVVAVNEQVRAATGIDVVSTVQRAVLRSAQPVPSSPTNK